jgi:hypothetical protein
MPSLGGQEGTSLVGTPALILSFTTFVSIELIQMARYQGWIDPGLVYAV